jgi:nucleotide-binding universal stress UspA family protein
MTQLKRILVPTDFSPPSELAVQYAVDLAIRLRAALHILHIVETPRYAMYPDGYFVGLADLETHATREAERRLADATRRYADRGLRVTTAVAAGIPAQRIVEKAVERGTDLIVMGTHGRSGFVHLLMGSVAERVVRTAPCPVLTVRDTPRLADLLADEESTAAAPDPRTT